MLLLLAMSVPASGATPERAKVEALKQRREGSLRVGDPAPDPTVRRLDGSPVRLLEEREADRPLVMVFGSFT